MSEKLGINCGCGQRRFTSTPEVRWINIDKVSRPDLYPAPDLVCDGTMIPRADASVDYFVLHHVLEHFGCGEAQGLIDEAYRVLRPGGSLLVFVPEVGKLAAKWLSGNLTTQVFMTNLYGAYMGDEADRHKWGYTYDSLAAFLQHVQWREVKLFDWRPIAGAAIARDFWIAGLECVR